MSRTNILNEQIEVVNKYLDSQQSARILPNAGYVFYYNQIQNGLDLADADRYANFNTILGYDVGIDTFRLLDSWFWEHNYDLIEFHGSDADRRLLQKALRETKISTLDFSKWSNKSNQRYEYLYFETPNNKPWKIWFEHFDSNGNKTGSGVSCTSYMHKANAYRAAKRLYGNRREFRYVVSQDNPYSECNYVFKVVGISHRIKDIFYVDIKPNLPIWLAYMHKVAELKGKDINYVDEYKGHFLNIACNTDDNTYELSSFFSEYGYIPISYDCTDEEKESILNFIQTWKDVIPENPDGSVYSDDTKYTHALADDIPWKNDVLR